MSRTPGIILDEWGNVREWVPVVTYLALVTVALVLIFTVANTSSTERLDKRLDLKAFCDSIGGSLGAEHCYKDGKIMKELEYGDWLFREETRDE